MEIQSHARIARGSGTTNQNSLPMKGTLAMVKEEQGDGDEGFKEKGMERDGLALARQKPCLIMIREGQVYGKVGPGVVPRTLHCGSWGASRSSHRATEPPSHCATPPPCGMRALGVQVNPTGNREFARIARGGKAEL